MSLSLQDCLNKLSEQLHKAMTDCVAASGRAVLWILPSPLVMSVCSTWDGPNPTSASVAWGAAVFLSNSHAGENAGLQVRFCSPALFITAGLVEKCKFRSMISYLQP